MGEQPSFLWDAGQKRSFQLMRLKPFLTKKVLRRKLLCHLISGVIRVDGNSCVSEHGLNTGGGHYHLLICRRTFHLNTSVYLLSASHLNSPDSSLTWSFNLVREGHQHSKLNLLFITWHRKKSSPRQLLFIDLEHKTHHVTSVKRDCHFSHLPLSHINLPWCENWYCF